MLGYGWLPRAMGVIAWVAVGFCAFVALFADLVDLPTWLRDISPFAHTPQAPLEAVTPVPVLILSGLVAAVLAAGFVGFRQRDVGRS